MLVTSSVVTGATAIRVGVGGASVALGRAPTLCRLGVEAAVLAAPGAGRAQSAFRDELVGLFREISETSWRELRRGVADLDELTRPRALAAAGQPDPHAPRRRHRVKP